jgi:ubiquinone/menaquinone biosynthesis C-methylase UbiE
MAISGGAQFLNPQEIFDKINLIQGMKIADLGCGNLGYFILPAAKIVGKEGIAYAVDILPSVLETVKGRGRLQGLTNLVIVRSNLEKVGVTDIPAASLDVALVKNMLFQNKQHKAVIQEAARLLKSAGKLVVIDWKKTGVPLGPPVDLRVDPEEIKGIAATLGLKLIEETEWGQYFWGLIFEKI